MPRGAHRDMAWTAAFRTRGAFKDKRSFYSTDGRFFLYGADKIEQYRRVYERDEKCCTVCGKFVGTSAEPDHKIKRSKGGDDSLDNLQILCARCHRTGKDAKHR